MSPFRKKIVELVQLVWSEDLLNDKKNNKKSKLKVRAIIKQKDLINK